MNAWRRHWGLWLTATLVGGWLLWWVVLPQGQVMLASLTPDPGRAGGDSWQHWRAVLSGSSYHRALWNSLWISTLSVLLAAIPGVTLAWVVERWRFPGRGLLLLAGVLPLALPPLVGVVGFFQLVAAPGLLPRLLSQLSGLPRSHFVLSAPLAVLLVHAYSFSVYFFAFTRAGLRSLDPAQEWAARSLGASAWRRWRLVLLPALGPHLLAALLLAFMAAIGSYSAPAILGGNLDYLTVALAADAIPWPGRAAVLAVILALLNIALLVLLRWALPNAWRGTASSKGTHLPPAARELRRPWARWLAGGAATAWLGVMALPMLVIALNALADHRAWRQAGGLWPPAFTAGHLTGLWQDPGAWRPVLVSLSAAGAATMLNLLMALPAAWLIIRGPRRLGWGLELGAMLPLALPGTVVAFNLLASFGAPGWLNFGQGLASTMAILVLAYVVRQTPLAVRPVVAAVTRLDPAQDLAARGLGAGWLRRWWRVILPPLLPGLAAGALLCLVTGLGEYVASVLLYSATWKPISIAIQECLQGDDGRAAAYALLLITLTGSVMAAYSWLTRERSPTRS